MSTQKERLMKTLGELDRPATEEVIAAQLFAREWKDETRHDELVIKTEKLLRQLERNNEAAFFWKQGVERRWFRPGTAAARTKVEPLPAAAPATPQAARRATP